MPEVDKGICIVHNDKGLLNFLDYFFHSQGINAYSFEDPFTAFLSLKINPVDLRAALIEIPYIYQRIPKQECPELALARKLQRAYPNIRLAGLTTNRKLRESEYPGWKIVFLPPGDITEYLEAITPHIS